MLPSKLINHLEEVLSEKIERSESLTGGDINDVYVLTTPTRKVVIKSNDASRFPKMFEAEVKGLQELKKSNTFTIPEVLYVGQLDNLAFLLLSYISSAERRHMNFWKEFGVQLAYLHLQSKPYFGLEKNNYIGSLPQYNTKCDLAAKFYITQRLQPQLEIAGQKGFSFSNLDGFYRTIENEIPDEKPSLIHGDLWSGNYIVDNQGLPCLIDPAIAYAPREMDIAMMYLFGGFDKELFKTYHAIFPLIKNWQDRLSIWQLYYLLVHLNLFGSSYYNSVKNIIDRYS